MDLAMKEVGDYAFLFATGGAIVFCLLYSFLARWWRTVIGRLIFSFMAVVAGILGLAGARLYFGPYPGITYIRPIAYVALAVILWSLVIAFVITQLKVLRNKKK